MPWFKWGQILYWTPQIFQFHDSNPPNTPTLLNFAVGKLSANRRPCRGVRLQSHVGKLANSGAIVFDYMYFIVPAILITSFPKKLKNSATEKTTASCAPPDHSSPPRPLLMSFLGQYTIHLLAMLKAIKIGVTLACYFQGKPYFWYFNLWCSLYSQK